MSITSLKIQCLYDKVAARRKVLSTFTKCEGNMKATAEVLGCHYHTLLRIIKKDTILSASIVEERERLSASGIQQRGFGESQRNAYAK
jgi:DNA-binding PucR family transcriptional regulator